MPAPPGPLYVLVTLVLLLHKVCPVFASLAGLYLQREDQ